MNFDLFSLRKLLKTLNDIHKNEIFTLEENVGTYTVYKDNRFYFEGVKSSEQDYAKILIYLLVFEILYNGEN